VSLLPARPANSVSTRPRTLALRLAASLALAVFYLCAAASAHAQMAPAGTVAIVQGPDVSVESGTPASTGSPAAPPSIYVSNGSAITVHSGKAQVKLLAGGLLDLCGPAKVSILEAGDAITLAFSFGRLHIQAPPQLALRIFTPTIIATPIDIAGAPRDITVGLGLDDSLCVLASGGAIRLEHQFTSEGLIVPQGGEFFLAAGKLVPVAGAPGTSQGQPLEVHIEPPRSPIPAPSQFALDTNPSPAPASKPAEPPAPAPSPAKEPSVEYSVLARKNAAHPTPKPSKDAHTNTSDQPVPPEAIPEYKVLLPPLTFSAASPTPPPDPSPEEVVLIRYTHVDPEWRFTGHVAPSVDDSKRHASASSPQPAAKPEKKKEGFWARLKHIFTS
jgi:hypothetical protein